MKRDKMDDFDSEAWLARKPEIGNLRAAIFDLNGVLAGQAPAAQPAEKSNQWRDSYAAIIGKS